MSRKRELKQQARVRRSSLGHPHVGIQTDGFVAIGEMPKGEQYPCLVCRQIPQNVHMDLFALQSEDVPTSLALPVGEKILAVTPCYQAKPGPWKIRLLILERFKTKVEGQ